MTITNDRLALELMGLPAEQREFWGHVLLSGIPSAARGRDPATAAERSAEGAPPPERASSLAAVVGEVASNPERVPLLESRLLELPREVRRRIAHLLLESVGTDPEYAQEAEEDAHRRWLELERGAVDGIDWETARATLRARFGR